jgi:opacity protein-like surface antigen
VVLRFTMKIAVVSLISYIATLGSSPVHAPQLASCPIFPTQSAWNQRVDGLPVAADSASLIRSMGADTPIRAGFGSGVYDGSRLGIPYIVVHGNRIAKSKVRFDYPRDSDKQPYPIPANVPIEGSPSHADTGDRHAVILDRDSCRLYELYALRWSGNRWLAGSGAIWSLRSNRLRPAGYTSADAAGLPILPGLARWQGDASTGRIDHALRFTVEHTRQAYLYPARHYASSSNDGTLPPMGLRVRLKASVDLSGLPRQTRIVAQAMKTYGMIVADNGPAWHVTGAPDPHWSDTDLQGLARLFGRDFEVVDTSRLRHP